jgi:hypothetical protein
VADDELLTKIAADIRKSGFGSEMAVLRTIRNADGWQATGTAYYIDLDTEAARESDVQAHTVCSSASEDDRVIHYQSFYGLSIEVKKAEKPWIVFKETPTYRFQLTEGLAGMVFCAGLKRQFRRGIGHTLSTTGLANSLGWYGNGMHEAFKNPDQPSRWYSAFVSACKAAEHALQQNSWTLDDTTDDDHSPYLWLSRPVVVLDGRLFSADLDQNNELVLNQESMCSVKFKYNTPRYSRRHYFVDVVTLAALGRYLAMCSERNLALAEALQKLAARGRDVAKDGDV